MSSESSQRPAWLAGLRAAVVGLLVLAVAHLAQAGAADPGADALLPVEMFYRHSDLDDARLSPSGKRLAVTVNLSQRLAPAVLDLAGGAAPQIVANFSASDVRSFAWVNDERLVFNLVE